MDLKPPLLFCSVNDSSPCKIIGGELNRNLVAGQDFDKVHPHLPGYMGQNAVTVFQFHPKHGVGQGLNHPAFNLYRLFFRHNLHSAWDASDPRPIREAPYRIRLRISGPFSVSTTECSK